MSSSWEASVQNAAEQRQDGDAIYVITSAVTGSWANNPFMESLLSYCDHHGAELKVIPIRYRNPTSTMEEPDDWIDPQLSPWLFTGRESLAPGLMLIGDVPIQPTAVRPLSGLQTFAGKCSTIFGHPKIALETIATRLREPAKIVTTTGAVTLPTYSDSKAGKKGEFHHVCGAVIVQVSGQGLFHIRHIKADSQGGFQDLGFYYRQTSVTPIRASVLTLGDLHGVRADPHVMDATVFSQNSLAKTLRPRMLVLHDVLDFQAANYHNNYFTRVNLFHTGQSDVFTELKKTFELLDDIAESLPDTQIFIVPSNHHDHFSKWLEKALNAEDIQNAWIYHKTKLAYVEACMKDESFDPFAFWSRFMSRNPDRLVFLGVGESLEVDGVEYGHHGHRGPNGTRGSIGGFLRVGAKMTVGHSHSPGIMDGVYQVGTSSLLDMGYNSDALSSWMATHCVHYENGSRTLVNIVDGQWTI